MASTGTEQMNSKLFSPFATTKQESGSGLGLWVSRSILEKHDGTIRVSSADSGYSGTTVSIFLPLAATPRAMTTLRQPLMATVVDS